jgi:hypothetical protein
MRSILDPSLSAWSRLLRWPVSTRHALQAMVVIAIVVYAALLRFDAIAQQFGPVTHR